MVRPKPFSPQFRSLKRSKLHQIPHTHHLLPAADTPQFYRRSGSERLNHGFGSRFIHRHRQRGGIFLRADITKNRRNSRSHLLGLLGTRFHRSPPYTGILPCFFGGRVSRLLHIISNASISRGRVSLGTITASIKPLAAAQ